MSAIDIQNSRQIRDPMDVLITLSLGTDVAMTYSGYSSAKVADGVLNQSSWPMRGLADLQGNGFPLDGSRVLYDPSTSPSHTSGKLGVRGNVGQPVSVTATGNGTIAALAISVTGAASVTLNGETTEITGSRVTLQLLNTTATLTFQPSSEDRRVEIITVLPEADFVINNDNLIKATVSLRSDLSIIDPTLPESELNVEVYLDDDVSEAAASIPEDTPITYQAGYPGDMSPVRKFYVSGKITWVDNILTLHAVDAVHFLDIEVPEMLLPDCMSYRISDVFTCMYGWFNRLGLTGKGNSPRGIFKWFNERTTASARNRTGLTEEGISLRELAAFCMNMFRFRDIDPAYLTTTQYGQDFIFDYVDAGIPTMRLTPSFGSADLQNTWTILENDCANIAKDVEKKYTALLMETKTIWGDPDAAINSGNTPVGTARWMKGLGVSLDFNAKCIDACVAVPASVLPNNYGWDWTPLAPMTDFGWGEAAVHNIKDESIFSARGDSVDFVLKDEIPNKTLISAFTYDRYYEGGVYTSLIPWGAKYMKEFPVWKYTTMQATWNALVNKGAIGRDATEWSCDIRGRGITEDARTMLVGDGTEENAPHITPRILGSILVARTPHSGVGAIEMYPIESLKNLMKRSNITGSFTWKGDPRIQPRDVFNFHRLDGTVEEWTFENITITHEGGGTLAEVTARKGIV